MKQILILFGIISATLCWEQRYDNYSLFRLIPRDQAQLRVLEDLKSSDNDLDFWVPPTKTNKFVNILVPPQKRNAVESLVEAHGIDAKVTVENIQDLIDQEKTHRQHHRSKRNINGRIQLYWTNYQVLEEIYEWFDQLAADYPSVVTVVEGGSSYEGRQIKGVKISRRSGNKAFFLEGGMIGADWLSPTVLTYIVNQLVSGKDPEALQASTDYDWYIFPVTNPDGFTYSYDYVRLWTKNRSPVATDTFGVDLTRNWNSHWGVVGANFTKSDEHYVGLGPFSEIETRSLAQFVENIADDVTVFLSFRSYGQRVTVPFGHTEEKTGNYDEAVIIFRRAMGALAGRYGTLYQVGTPSEVLDEPYSASAADWAKRRFDFPITGTYHLRDEGSRGYILPVDQVEPTCIETMDSILSIVREGERYGYL